MPLTDHASGQSGNPWYDLFSRGTRDWLRHNEKVRNAVRDALPDLVAGSDVLSRPGNRTVQVPVRFMEHYRFRLRDPEEQQGAGQGKAEPGDVLRHAQPGKGRAGSGAGGEGDGGLKLLLEFQVDDILDWIWEDLQLPNLKPRPGTQTQEDELIRGGWDKRGARSRLDRRRTVKEAVKRRRVQGESAAPFSNEDLRFRQLLWRRRPTTNAVVFFLLDVSSSMDDRSRRLAKTFFFWALQGIRRQFTRIDTVFIAHTVEAWEFQEEEFFRVHGEGGTRSSAAFTKAAEILGERFDPARYNSYLFYATDGENFVEDRERAGNALIDLAGRMNYLGYAEISSRRPLRTRTEVALLFDRLIDAGASAGSYAISSQADIWPAIKAFLTDQAEDAA